MSPKNRRGHFFSSKTNEAPFFHFKCKNVDILTLTYDKINEATFFYSSLKKRQMRGIETDEGGPEKHFF